VKIILKDGSSFTIKPDPNVTDPVRASIERMTVHVERVHHAASIYHAAMLMAWHLTPSRIKRENRRQGRGHKPFSRRKWHVLGGR